MNAVNDGQVDVLWTEAQPLCRAAAAVLAADLDFAQHALERGASLRAAGSPPVTDAQRVIHWLSNVTRESAGDTASLQTQDIAVACGHIAAGITEIMGKAELGNSRVMQCAQDLARLENVLQAATRR